MILSLEILRKYGFTLFVVGSGCYLTQIMSLSPVYLLFVLAALGIGLALLGGSRSLRLDSIFFLSAICMAYAISLHGVDSDLGSLVGYVFSLLAGLMVYWSYPVNPSARRTAASAVRGYIYFSTVLGVAEAAYRLTHPSFDKWNASQIAKLETENLLFYPYKMSSIMYQDSNFVGMWLLFTFLIALLGGLGVGRKWMLALFVLLCLTFSRAAIAASILGMVYLAYTRSRFKPVYIGFAATMVTVFFSWAVTDESFLSKIEILQSAVWYANKASTYELFFGVGLGNSIDALIDRASHNLLVTLFVETGVVGMFAYIALVIAFLRKARSMTPVVILYVVAGMSLASLATPYIFVVLALYAKHLEQEARS